jgi:hypothetical protein
LPVSKNGSPDVNDQPSSAETPAERQGRLRAILLEHQAVEKREAFRVELQTFVQTGTAMAFHAAGLKRLFDDVKSGLPSLVEIVREAATDRHALPAARAWWHELRQAIADKAQREADALPKTVEWRRPWGSGTSRTPDLDPDPEVASVNGHRRHEMPGQRADRIRKLRAAGMSIRQIVKQTGLTHGTVQRAAASVPNGTPNPEPDVAELPATPKKNPKAQKAPATRGRDGARSRRTSQEDASRA